MSEFTMKFSTNNAAFVEGREGTVADIVSHVSDQIEEGYTSGVVYDYNGNAVGAWSLDLPEEEREPIEEPDEDDPAYNDTDLDENDQEIAVRYSEMEREWLPVEDAVWDEHWGSYVIKGKKY